MAFTIEPLDSRKHKRAAFCSGKNSLDNYIRKQASQDFKRGVATVFVLVDSPNPDVLTYYTLSSYRVEIAELNDSFKKSLPRYPRLPATLLGRLAVDSTHQGKHLGELLLVDALKRALDASLQVASVAIVVEALDEQAANFYQKYGFEPFKQYPLKLYLPMKSVAELCQMLGI